MNNSASNPLRRLAQAIAVCVALLLSLLLPAGSAHAAPVTMPIGVQYADTVGNPVQAHGAGVIYTGGYYYWFGENRNPDDTFYAVSVYRSTDMKTWEFRGNALTQASSPDLQSAKVERPKVIYNASTGQFVMWVHKEDVAFTQARVAVAVSSTVDGSYTYQGSFQPLGDQSRDLTLFKDDDGTAYMISAANSNADLNVYKLTADYTNAASLVQVLYAGARREAPAMFKRNGVYFLLTSGQNSWLPTQQQYSTASCVACAFTPLANVGDAQAYGSQTAYVQPIQGTSGTSYLYMGDRWAGSWGGPVNTSTYVWLPLQFPTSTTMTMPYAAQLTIDTAAGTVTTSGTGYSTVSLPLNGLCAQANNAAVVQQTCGGGTNQQWRIDSENDGYYRLVVASTDQCLDNNTGGAITWTCGTTKPSQQWALQSTGNGNVEVVQHSSGLCLTSNSSRTNAQFNLSTCTGAADQQFLSTAL